MPAEVTKQMQINEFRRTTLYTDWKVNQPIAASVFQFQPPAGAEKVDTFIPKAHGRQRIRVRPHLPHPPPLSP